MPELYLLNNDMILRLSGAYTLDQTTGLPVYLTASATVGVTVLDAATEEEIDPETWPLALSYIAGSRGDFLGVLRDTLEVEAGQALIGRVTADNGDDQHMERDIEIQVVRARI